MLVGISKPSIVAESQLRRENIITNCCQRLNYTPLDSRAWTCLRQGLPPRESLILKDGAYKNAVVFDAAREKSDVTEITPVVDVLDLGSNAATQGTSELPER